MRTFHLNNQSDEKNTTQLSHAECALQSPTDINVNLLLTLRVQLGCSFTVCLAEHLVCGWCGIVFPLPPLPLYIWVVWGCYSLACLQSCWLIFICQLFSFIPFFQWFSLLLSLLLLLFLFYFSLFCSASTECFSV